MCQIYRILKELRGETHEFIVLQVEYTQRTKISESLWVKCENLIFTQVQLLEDLLKLEHSMAHDAKVVVLQRQLGQHLARSKCLPLDFFDLIIVQIHDLQISGANKCLTVNGDHLIVTYIDNLQLH